MDFGNVRLVGMTANDLQDMYKFYKKENPATGIDEVWMLPDDVILNTRRAFSTSNTTVSGYSTSLGAPEGRYIAPANSADCIQVRAGDCAPRNVLAARAVVQAVRLRRGEAVRHRRHEEHRGAVRHAQRVRHAELHPVGGSGTNTAAGTAATIFQVRPPPTPTRATPTIRAAGSAS